MASNPTCEDPYGEHAKRNTMAQTKQVHHVRGLATHPELAFDESNLMSVCWTCHARLESEARSDRD